MSLAGRSRSHVETLLAELEAGYQSFPVTQTTVSVPAGCYEATADEWRQEAARADVHVHNDAGEVLVLTDDDGPRAPRSVVGTDESIETRARRAVNQSVGVECRIEGLEAVTIAGVQHETDPNADPIYRLVALFDGTHVAGTPAADWQWRADPPESRLLI